jgi:hypothetical protein
MKLVVNTLLGVGMQAIAEAVALGQKAGLNRDRLFDVLSHTAVVAPAHVGKLAKVARNDYTPSVCNPAHEQGLPFDPGGGSKDAGAYAGDGGGLSDQHGESRRFYRRRLFSCGSFNRKSCALGFSQKVKTHYSFKISVAQIKIPALTCRSVIGIGML